MYTCQRTANVMAAAAAHAPHINANGIKCAKEMIASENTGKLCEKSNQRKSCNALHT